MYEKQFGLSRRPFRANAAGTDVFVGPQTAKLMTGMKKAFGATEAVVLVTGEAGVGKSTLVTRAIEAISGEKLMIHISRMQLGHDEVPEFLLDKLGADNVPAGTIKKINLCRDLLAARTSAGTRVFIIIEDAGRLGEDALAEFEALTAPDTGFAEGANLVLMGDDSVVQQLKSTALVRLQQRTRMRHSVPPLAAGEMMAYLKHCFRLAGGEFDVIFAEGTGQALFELSKGNPRVVNNLVDSLLSTAAEKNVSKINRAMVARVAREDLALSADSAPEPAAPQQPEAAAAPAKDEIPDLIQDTQPEIIALEAEDLTAAPDTSSEDPPDWDKDPTMAELKPDIEALEQAMADLEVTEDEPEDEKESEPVPEVELKDPTLPGVPELTLDTSIDDKVSEAQEALAQTNDEIEANAAPAQPLANDADQSKAGVPPLVSPAPAAPDAKVDPEMMQIAANLARAKSIEDVDDKMAETLFGEELNLAAAELMAARPEPANQDVALEADAAAAPVPAPAAPPAAAPTAAPAAPPAAAPTAAPAAPAAAAPAAAPAQCQAKKPFDEGALEVSAAVQTSGGLDLSASQRLATVRALNTVNTGKVAAVGTPPTAPANNPAAPGTPVTPAAPGTAAKPAAPGQPASIEDQINTEMTQTFQALNSRPRLSNDDDDESSKTGFFSRFKRS